MVSWDMIGMDVYVWVSECADDVRENNAERIHDGAERWLFKYLHSSMYITCLNA